MLALEGLGRGAIPVHAWVSEAADIEPGAMKQIEHLARIGFAHDHIAVMPDVHLGYGMPIGGVIATQDVIIPSAIGADIGCGLLALGTGLPVKRLSEQALQRIRQCIFDTVPMGFLRHLKPQSQLLMPAFDREKCPIAASQLDRARYQLGTLGSGNHFIEFDADEKSELWVLIHSGSRNLGLRVATHYSRVAKEFTRAVGLVPAGWDLDVLPLGTEEGWQYAHEMYYCARFAKANRLQMMDRAYRAIGLEANLPRADLIDVAHNYASLEKYVVGHGAAAEEHMVVVHRKGAIMAAGTVVIPGSQGTRSYIGRGLGNEASWRSCSHGAGRRMSRAEAKVRLSLPQQQVVMAQAGVIHGMQDVSDLGEAPGAYKDIDWVMEQQADLVAIEHTLRPIMVIKG